MRSCGPANSDAPHDPRGPPHDGLAGPLARRRPTTRGDGPELGLLLVSGQRNLDVRQRSGRYGGLVDPRDRPRQAARGRGAQPPLGGGVRAVMARGPRRPPGLRHQHWLPRGAPVMDSWEATPFWRWWDAQLSTVHLSAA